MDDDLSSIDGLLNFNYNTSILPSLDQPIPVIEQSINEAGEAKPYRINQNDITDSTLTIQQATGSYSTIGVHPLPVLAPNGAQKPPYTYPEMIEFAIEKCGPSTVSQIYDWIAKKFKYYRSIEDAKWKPGIRHTLTTHSMFVKTRKDKNYRGWLWALVPPDQRKKYGISNVYWKKKSLIDYDSIIHLPSSVSTSNTSTTATSNRSTTATSKTSTTATSNTLTTATTNTLTTAVVENQPVQSCAPLISEENSVVTYSLQAPQYLVVNTKTFFETSQHGDEKCINPEMSTATTNKMQNSDSSLTCQTEATPWYKSLEEMRVLNKSKENGNDADIQFSDNCLLYFEDHVNPLNQDSLVTHVEKLVEEIMESPPSISIDPIQIMGDNNCQTRLQNSNVSNREVLNSGANGSWSPRDDRSLSPPVMCPSLWAMDGLLCESPVLNDPYNDILDL